MILTIRTDKPEAEIGLFDNNKKVAYETWEAHRELSDTLLKKIDDMLQQHSMTPQKDLNGIVAFKGPGSFTGLRIGLTVGNALAYAVDVPIVAVGGDDWIQDGIARINNGDNDRIAMPEYGGEANITRPKK